ncbi:MAG: sugar phosphate isomerase/epimerase [Oscillospiraceae bacterium]|nr:sugar phosphate isomerase/epimerase [Oscillospiraceae bacterium]
MIAAVSTSCLYPKPTEDALYDLCLHGIRSVEIFLNAPRECNSVFTGDLRALLRRFGTQCSSVHPWTGSFESFMLFSDYPRRAADFLEDAKRVFSMMNTVGAKYYVLHGASAGRTRPELYCERFHMLAETAKPFGVEVTQENVNLFESQSIRFLKEFCRILGDEAKITFDVKQAVRAHMDISEAVRLLGKHIVQVHLSDHGDLGDCLRIGTGRFQIAPFLRALRAQGFDGNVTLELYRGSFGSTAELAEDYAKIERLIRIAEKE